MRSLLCLVMTFALFACSHGPSASGRTESDNASTQGALGEVARPPFAVRGDLSGLLVMWFDAQGTHVAQRRDEIPEASRTMVRVDSQQGSDLDPAFVYVADVSHADAHGNYVVRKVARDTLDAHVDRLRPAPAPEVADVQAAADPDQEAAHPANRGGGSGKPGRVILYGASWCGVCHQAAAYMRANNIAFVEHDIEREAGARQEMQSKCARAHLRCSGIPVIDANGTILEGFSVPALRAAIGG